MKVGYDFHPEAETDLTDICDYIAVDSPEAADRVLDAILKRLESLVKIPLQGHMRTDLTSRPLRFVNVYEYLIAYAPGDDPLWVVAIMHGKRNPRVMAALLRERE